MLGPLIRARRRSLGLTLEALAREAGCTKGYLSAIETGRRERPPSEALLERIEKALKMEAGALLSEGRWASTPTEIRRTLAGLERRTRAAARLAELVLREGRERGAWSPELERLASRLSRGAEDVGGWADRAPVINTVEEGYPVMPEARWPWRRARGVVSAPVDLGAGAFAVRVVGDAMEPAYGEGDVAIVRPAAGARSGEDCFVRLFDGAETTFRRVFRERDASGRETVRLQPLNPAHGARLVLAEEVCGVWEAAYVLRRAGGGGG